MSASLHLRPTGFSLVEVLVVMSLVGLLAGLAVPRMTSLFERYRVDTVHTELLASLQLARVEALRQSAPIVVERQTGCATVLDTGNNWSCGWFIYADTNGNSQRDVANEPVLQTGSLPPQTRLHKSANAPLNRVWVDRLGQVQPLALHFSIRPADGLSPHGGMLCMGAGARFRWVKGATSCG